MYIHYKGLCKGPRLLQCIASQFLLTQWNLPHPPSLCSTRCSLSHLRATDAYRCHSPAAGALSGCIQFITFSSMIVWEELIACDPDKNKAATSNPFFITKAVFIFLFWAYFIIKLNCYRKIFFWDSFIIIIRLVCDSWVASFFRHSYHSRPGCGQKKVTFHISMNASDLWVDVV